MTKNLFELLDKVKFDGCDIHSFDGLVVAMTDLEKIINEILTDLDYLNCIESPEGIHYVNLNIIKAIFGSKEE